MSKEAMKLALEALENSVDLVSHEARNAEELYGKYPTRLARVQGLVALEVAHEKAITALRKALKPDWTDTPCYEWPGNITVQGYGQLGTAKKLGKNTWAHRLVWEAVNGPIPEGLSIDHLCRNRACVNPQHLEPVTHKENCLRGVGVGAINSKKTECKNGHPFDELNTGYLKSGKRYCKECQKIHTAAWRAK